MVWLRAVSSWIFVGFAAINLPLCFVGIILALYHLGNHRKQQQQLQHLQQLHQGMEGKSLKKNNTSALMVFQSKGMVFLKTLLVVICLQSLVAFGQSAPYLATFSSSGTSGADINSVAELVLLTLSRSLAIFSGFLLLVRQLMLSRNFFIVSQQQHMERMQQQLQDRKHRSSFQTHPQNIHNGNNLGYNPLNSQPPSQPNSPLTPLHHSPTTSLSYSNSTTQSLMVNSSLKVLAPVNPPLPGYNLSKHRGSLSGWTGPELQDVSEEIIVQDCEKEQGEKQGDEKAEENEKGKCQIEVRVEEAPGEKGEKHNRSECQGEEHEEVYERRDSRKSSSKRGSKKSESPERGGIHLRDFHSQSKTESKGMTISSSKESMRSSNKGSIEPIKEESQLTKESSKSPIRGSVESISTKEIKEINPENQEDNKENKENNNSGNNSHSSGISNNLNQLSNNNHQLIEFPPLPSTPKTPKSIIFPNLEPRNYLPNNNLPAISVSTPTTPASENGPSFRRTSIISLTFNLPSNSPNSPLLKNALHNPLDSNFEALEAGNWEWRLFGLASPKLSEFLGKRSTIVNLPLFLLGLYLITSELLDWLFYSLGTPLITGDQNQYITMATGTNCTDMIYAAAISWDYFPLYVARMVVFYFWGLFCLIGFAATSVANRNIPYEAYREVKINRATLVVMVMVLLCWTAISSSYHVVFPSSRIFAAADENANSTVSVATTSLYCLTQSELTTWGLKWADNPSNLGQLLEVQTSITLLLCPLATWIYTYLLLARPIWAVLRQDTSYLEKAEVDGFNVPRRLSISKTAAAMVAAGTIE